MTRHALIVACGAYAKRDDGREFAELHAPRANARAMHGLLQDPRTGGYESRLCADPTRSAFVDAIDRFVRDTQQKLKANADSGSTASTVVVYFSGHGFKDQSPTPSLYLCTTDSIRSAIDIEQSAVSARYLWKKILAIPAQHRVLILDCCYAGAAIQSLKKNTGDYSLDDLPRRSGILYSAGPNSLADDSSSDTPSHFTQTLVNAWRNKPRSEAVTEVLVRDLLGAVQREGLTQQPGLIAQSSQSNWDEVLQMQVGSALPPGDRPHVEPTRIDLKYSAESLATVKVRVNYASAWTVESLAPTRVKVTQNSTGFALQACDQIPGDHSPVVLSVRGTDNQSETRVTVHLEVTPWQAPPVHLHGIAPSLPAVESVAIPALLAGAVVECESDNEAITAQIVEGTVRVGCTRRSVGEERATVTLKNAELKTLGEVKVTHKQSAIPAPFVLLGAFFVLGFVMVTAKAVWPTSGTQVQAPQVGGDGPRVDVVSPGILQTEHDVHSVVEDRPSEGMRWLRNDWVPLSNGEGTMQFHEVSIAEFKRIQSVRDSCATRPLCLAVLNDPDEQLPMHKITRVEARDYCRAIGAELPPTQAWIAQVRALPRPSVIVSRPEFAAPSSAFREPISSRERFLDLIGNATEWTDDGHGGMLLGVGVYSDNRDPTAKSRRSPDNDQSFSQDSGVRCFRQRI